MAVFFISPTPEDTARMHHLLAGYDLPARIVPAQTRLLDTVNDPGQNSLFLREGKISGSFILAALGLVFLSEEDIFVKKPAAAAQDRRAKDIF